MKPPESLEELAAASQLSESFRRTFDVRLVAAARLLMNEQGWMEAEQTMKSGRDAVERQHVVVSRDCVLGLEAMMNPLRARRTSLPEGAPTLDWAEPVCRWCDRRSWHVSRDPLWEDDFGSVRSHDGRVCARPNWARNSEVSGLVYGDEAMHNPLTIARADFVAMFDAAEQYIAAARRTRPDIENVLIFQNNGTRSASSVPHCHLQVCGRSDRHYGYAENILARSTATYWADVAAAHEEVGLLTQHEGGRVWANLVPAKERDVTGISLNVSSGAAMMYDVMQSLTRRGSNSFSLAGILAPWLVRGQTPSGRYINWPAVVWRMVDRGDRRTPWADIGTMELFGSPVVSTDPFDVIRCLKEDGARFL